LQQEAPEYGGRSGGSGLLGMLGGMDKSFRGKRQQAFEKEGEARIREQVKLAKDEATTKYKDWEDDRKEWNRREEDRVKQENIYRTEALKEARGEHKEAVTKEHQETVEADKARTAAATEQHRREEAGVQAETAARAERTQERVATQSMIGDVDKEINELTARINKMVSAGKTWDDWEIGDKPKGFKPGDPGTTATTLGELVQERTARKALREKFEKKLSGYMEQEERDTQPETGGGAPSSAAPSGGTQPATTGQPSGKTSEKGKPMDGGARAKARSAIAQGADRNAVLKRLKESGYDTTEFDKPDKSGSFKPISGDVSDMPSGARPPASDYDIEGYRKKYGEPDQSKGQHLTDEFKLPNHMTFSSQSKYSNPNRPGGDWSQKNGQWHFAPSMFNLRQHPLPEMQDYFARREPNSTLDLPTPTPRPGGIGAQALPPPRPATPLPPSRPAFGGGMPQVGSFGGGFDYGDYARRVSRVESRGGKDLGRRGNEYQMGKAEQRKYGTGPEGMQNYTKDHYKQMMIHLGRMPTPGEVYLAHQQGVSGALKLLENPNKIASKVVAPSHIINNDGNLKMTAGEFIRKQNARFAGSTQYSSQ
jgi:hypothetical protein